MLAKDTGEYEARDVIQEMSLAVYEAVTGTTVDPGWSRGGSVPQESAAADPPAGPSLAENTQAAVGSVKPASSLPAEKPLTQEPPSENRQNAVPEPRFAIPALSRNPATREPAKPVPPPYPVTQEPANWEKSLYWDEW